MNAYNKVNNVNIDHAVMMENNSIKQLIENIALDKIETIPYVTYCNQYLGTTCIGVK
jgi:hypothetical protein